MQKKNNNNLIAAVSILAIFALLSIPSIIHWFTSRDINTDVIRNGTIEDAVEASAIIVRNEKVKYANVDGIANLNKIEGDRVGPSTLIAGISKPATSEYEKEIKNIELQIVDRKRKLQAGKEIFSPDIKKLNEEIEKNLTDIIQKNSRAESDQISSITQELNRATYKKSTIFGGNSNSDPKIKELIARSNELQNKIKYNTVGIKGDMAGLVSFSIDNYEDKLKPENISELSQSFFEKFKISDNTKTIDKGNIEAGKPILKIIDDKYFYLTMLINEKDAKLINTGDYIKNTFIMDYQIKTNSWVTFKSESENKKVILCLRIDKYLNQLTSLRMVNVKIVKNYYNGLKVSLKSLIKINYQKKTAKIAKVIGNSISYCDVILDGWNNEFAVIKDDDSKFNDINKIELYNTYIVNPDIIRKNQTYIEN